MTARLPRGHVCQVLQVQLQDLIAGGTEHEVDAGGGYGDMQGVDVLGKDEGDLMLDGEQLLFTGLPAVVSASQAPTSAGVKAACHITWHFLHGLSMSTSRCLQWITR